MKHKRLFIFFIVVLLSSGTISLIYSNDKIGTFSQPTVKIGRLVQNKSDLIYRGIKVSEFSLDPNGSMFPESIYTESDEIRKRLFDLIGQQVMISGEIYPVDIQLLLKENPSATELMEISLGFVRLMKAYGIEPITFYQITVPEKIIWGEPIKFELQLKNPLDKNIENITLQAWFYYGGYPGFKKKIILSAGEEKDIEIDLGKSDPYWGQRDGASIKLFICDDIYGIYFDDKIASYGPDGVLKNE